MDLLITALPGFVAVAWLALREIAPKTPTDIDDRLVEIVERTVGKVRSHPEDAARKQ